MKNFIISTLLFVIIAPQAIAFSCYELQDAYQQQSCLQQEEMLRLQQQQMVNNNLPEY